MLKPISVFASLTALAAISWRMDDAHQGVRRQPIERLASAVSGAVVHDEDLAVRRERHLDQAADDRRNRGRLVEHGHDDGDE